jgi:hypothetical protein
MKTAEVIREMIFFFGNDKKRIAPAFKVYAYAQAIGELENLDAESLEADYLVNLEEGKIPLSQKDGIFKNHFRTKNEKDMLLSIFRQNRSG